MAQNYDFFPVCTQFLRMFLICLGFALVLFASFSVYLRLEKKELPYEKRD